MICLDHAAASSDVHWRLLHTIRQRLHLEQSRQTDIHFAMFI